MATPPVQARERGKPQGDEEAGAELKLGEFTGVDTMNYSEAALIIQAIVEKRRKTQKVVNDTEIFQKTTEYLEHFARFKTTQAAEAIGQLLAAHKELEKFERAQLGSLCCDSAEEAKTLIPSLTDKITDEDLQELLDEITKLMGYGN